MRFEIKEVNDFSDEAIVTDLNILYQSVFAEEIMPYIAKISDYQNKIILLAYVENQPAGFKIGYCLPEDQTTLYSWAGGTANQYRNLGIGSALMRHQHKKSAALGIKYIETKCRDKWASMMKLNQKFGFIIAKEYLGSCGTKKYLLRRKLD